MKTWSRSWVRSKDPSKQRKYSHNAPLHIARKLMSVNLSKELREKHGKRNVPVRKGDTVKVMVGSHKGKVAKVTEINLKQKKVYVDGVVSVKKDGTKIARHIHPSNLRIIELNLDDKLRKKLLERK